MASVPRLLDTAAAATGDDDAGVLLDLSGLTFMDSTGLVALLRLRDTLGGRLALVPGPERVQELFALTGTAALFGFVPGSGVLGGA